MLTEERHHKILDLVNQKGSITVSELKDLLGISESTARRDIVSLDKMGRLEKVFGGALAIKEEVLTVEPTVSQKADLCIEEKRAIAEYATGLVEPSDLVYVDSGTTTLSLVRRLPQISGAVFVTNGIAHAEALNAAGNKVILIGGELKNVTEAIVGTTAVLMIQQFRFTKGFFGVNGISRRAGLTTPEYNEALVKQEAMRHCQNCYVLADSSKFHKASAVTFGDISHATIITEKIPDGYQNYPNIISC